MVVLLHLYSSPGSGAKIFAFLKMGFCTISRGDLKKKGIGNNH